MITKDFLKKMARWTIPTGIYDFLRDIRRKWQLQLQCQAVKTVLARNRVFKDAHRGGRCFILGTGPSIKHQDLRALRNEICISVANFFVHPDFDYIRPRYHCIPPLHAPFTDQDGIRWFRKMEPYMKHTTLFLGISDKRLIDRNTLFQDRQVRYFQFGGNWVNPTNADFDISHMLPGCQSVSIMALMVALYIGCREIYLLGADHTTFNLDNGRYDYRHFYDAKATNELGEQAPPKDLENEFKSAAELWRQYKVLREYTRTKDITIFNATGGGILDLFPRVTFETLFKHGCISS